MEEKSAQNRGVKFWILSIIQLVLAVMAIFWIWVASRGTHYPSRQNELFVDLFSAFFPLGMIYLVILSLERWKKRENLLWYVKQLFSVTSVCIYGAAILLVYSPSLVEAVKNNASRKQFENLPQIEERVGKIENSPDKAFPVSETEFIYSEAPPYRIKKFNTQTRQTITLYKDPIASFFLLGRLDQDRILLLKKEKKVSQYQIYDMKNNAFSNLNSFEDPKQYRFLTTLKNGKILFLNLNPNQGHNSAQLEIVDPAKGERQLLKSHISGTLNLRVFVLNDNEILFVRGIKELSQKYEKEVLEHYTLDTDRLKKIAEIPGYPENIMPLDRDHLLLMMRFDAFILDLKTANSHLLHEQPLCTRGVYSFHYPEKRFTAQLKNGKILFVGAGKSPGDKGCDVYNVLDPKSLKFEPIGKADYEYNYSNLIEMSDAYYLLGDGVNPFVFKLNLKK